jgi:hypothetical protein
MNDLNGMWLGTYWQNAFPTRFEATLIQGGNALTGMILDDNDLGEAQLAGEILGRSIQFTKRYLTGLRHTVFYYGNLAETGNAMHGTWNIGPLYTGTWEAHRHSNDLMLDLKHRLTQSIPVTSAIAWFPNPTPGELWQVEGNITQSW